MPGAEIGDGIINVAPADNEESILWTNLSEDNTITTGCRCRQPRVRSLDYRYHLTTVVHDMDNFLLAQTTYIESMETIAQVDEVVDSAINHIVLTQLGMKKGIKTFDQEYGQLSKK